MRPTLKDIAAELNLSHPTVSRALAGQDSISAETRLRVREAAERLGYVANSSARMLRVGEANVVGLLLPDITNEFYAAVAKRLADDCSARNERLLLSISADDPVRELALVRTLLEARPSAVVVALTAEPRAETVALLRGARCVQFMQTNAEIDGPAVTVEASGGARLAIEHLLRLGHARIGFVGPDASTALGRARIRGVAQALRDAGRDPGVVMSRLGRSDAAFGEQAVGALLDGEDPPTAIYLSSAPISVGGVRALSRRGLSIPGDMSVIVAGSSAWYDVWPGGLTSITLPMTDLADAVSRMLAEKERKAARVELAFAMIERGSTLPRGSSRTV